MEDRGKHYDCCLNKGCITVYSKGIGLKPQLLLPDISVLDVLNKLEHHSFKGKATQFVGEQKY